MVQNRNSEVSRRIAEGFSLYGYEETPQAVQNYIQPTLDVGKIPTRKVATSDVGSSGTITLFTTSSTQKTYISYINFSTTKSATCDASGSFLITGVIGGITTTLLGISNLTTTAETKQATLSLGEHPILLDKGTAVTMTGTFGVASLIRNCQVGYYEVETSS